MSPKRSATTSSPCLAHPSRMRTIASGRCMPHYMALLVEAYGKVGQAKEGLPVLADGLATVERVAEFPGRSLPLDEPLVMSFPLAPPRWSFRLAPS